MNTPSFHRNVAPSQAHLNTATGHAAGTPFASPDDAQRLEPVEFLRSTLERRRCHYSDPRLERFALEFFANDNMVWAYFFPREVGPNPHPKSFGAGAPLNTKAVWTPLEVAMVAASQAQSMAIVLPHEREFIHLATLVYPCALFHSVRTAATVGYERMSVSPEWLIHLRGLFVTDALRALRRQDPAVADTLKAVLGLPGEGDIHPDQVSRLASAVRLAHLQTRAVWATSRV